MKKLFFLTKSRKNRGFWEITVIFVLWLGTSGVMASQAPGTPADDFSSDGLENSWESSSNSISFEGYWNSLENYIFNSLQEIFDLPAQLLSKISDSLQGEIEGVIEESLGELGITDLQRVREGLNERLQATENEINDPNDFLGADWTGTVVSETEAAATEAYLQTLLSTEAQSARKQTIKQSVAISQQSEQLANQSSQLASASETASSTQAIVRNLSGQESNTAQLLRNNAALLQSVFKNQEDQKTLTALSVQEDVEANRRLQEVKAQEQHRGSVDNMGVFTIGTQFSGIFSGQ